ncbi:hypothetical protein Goari_000830 [Gossypium aridum]|uniref:Uncharacterized protein n=1 Tax=Gossypium aridum TaxID=34290 RepID=A0A7J8YHV6_GOSAI|nr:hypothetical protein [Gossypium aridum]
MVSTYCNRFYANKPELAARRIEAIGYQVGHQLSERLEDSSLLVCICFYMKPKRSHGFKELLRIRYWSMFGKSTVEALIICEVQMLQVVITKFSRCQGTFVLQDNRFCWLTRMSIDQSPENGTSEELSIMADNKAMQSMHLYFPCGIIRGALSNLGIPCAVSADISNLPAWLYKEIWMITPITRDNENLTFSSFDGSLVLNISFDVFFALVCTVIIMITCFWKKFKHNEQI